MGSRSVIVTGAARGLGHAMAEVLRIAGHDVLAVDRDALSARDFAAGAGRLETLSIDLAIDDAADRILADCQSRFGRIEGLVSCAGIGQETISADFVTKPVNFWTVDDRDWDRIFAVNLRAAFRLCRAAAPHMVAAGWGRFVIVTTSLETMIRVGMVPYGPSKAALEAMAAIMAKELEGTGVTSNVLVPGGPANTRMMPNIPEPQRSMLVQPDVMRAPVTWLMSDEADGINGMRFRANAWDDSLPGPESAKVAGAPAAWAGIQGGAAKVAGRNEPITSGGVS